jgi:integrase/recombinase XerD
MSGKTTSRGRFSETYPPERRCIRLNTWPEGDRLAFERARTIGDAFELSGLAARWAPETCRTRLQAYGRYLNFLSRKNLLLASQGPADRVTPERLALYLAEARQFLSACTIVQVLRELSSMLRAMAPEHDWRWITRHPGRPSTIETRTSRRPKKTFNPMALCCDALDLLDSITAGPIVPESRILYRNALIVVIQCGFVLRRRNLVDMVLGRNLIIGDDVIHLVFSADETKNDFPIRCTMPEFLKPYLFAYLEEHRPVLLAGHMSDAVWINSRHKAVEYGACPYLFTSIGVRLLGYPITSHTFRHSVATTILTKDPRNVRMASGVLTHRSVNTTSQHYDLGGDIASRRVWDKLRRDIIRGKGLQQT